MKRPLVAVLFSAGIGMADRVRCAFLPVYCLAVALLLAGLIAQRKKLIGTILLCCAAVCLGASCLKNAYRLPSSHVARLLHNHSGGACEVRGFVESQPRKKNNLTEFIFAAEEIKIDNLAYRCCGKLLVELAFAKDVSYGEELAMRGKVYRPFAFGGQRLNWRNYLNQQGIFCLMRVERERAAVSLGTTRGFALNRFALRLKRRIEDILFGAMPILPAGIADAMLLGEKRYIPALIQDRMIKCGTVHILSRLYTKMPSVAL